MIYICKGCDNRAEAKDMKEIQNNGKLCDDCISKNNIKNRRYKKLDKRRR